MMKLKQILAALVLTLLTALSFPATAIASQATSSNYGVSEVRFGTGSELHACSTAYCAKQTVGELTNGNTRSTNNQAQAGYNTNRQPLLEVSVAGATVDLGVMDATTTKTGSTTFSVRTYLASGYDVFVDGTSPKHKSSGHVLTPMASMTTSQVGIEQFGLNLRANTTPSVGADAVQVPSSAFSFGAAAAGYSTVNNFKYVAGDKIAGSTSSSGETDYTLSMIANVGTTTIGGAYGGRLVINVVPTF